MTENETIKRLETTRGVAGVIVTDGQNVTLHAPFAAPPGSPLAGKLIGTSHELRLKVHGCRRLAESANTVAGDRARSGAAPQFEITGRWVNLSREARLALLGVAESA